MKAIEQYFQVVLFVFDNILQNDKMKFKIFSSVLNFAHLEVKGLMSMCQQGQIIFLVTFANKKVTASCGSMHCIKAPKT